MDSRFIDMLAPVSAQSPCGEDLSFSPEFDRIQEARREDDPTVDYGEWQAALKQADWNVVVDICADLLARRSKDLRLAAWMAEGLAKSGGLRGLADGMETNARLLERFGQDIHPRSDEGDQERRIGAMTWLVSRMAQLARQIPLTAAQGYSLNDYEAARQRQQQLQCNPDAEHELEGKVTPEQFAAAAAKTDKVLVAQWLDDAQHCIRAVAELERACDALFGADGPSFSLLANSVGAVGERLQAMAREIGLPHAEERAAGFDESACASLPMPVSPKVAGATIASRQQALELLRQVAAYFRHAEPHSPVAYLADKAAHWGSLPLHAWLRSVVKDRGSLDHIEELLGLEADENASRR